MKFLVKTANANEIMVQIPPTNVHRLFYLLRLPPDLTTFEVLPQNVEISSPWKKNESVVSFQFQEHLTIAKIVLQMAKCSSSSGRSGTKIEIMT